MNLAFIGIGDMGSEMVPHLVSQDYQVTIWDRDTEKLKQDKLKKSNVKLATSLKNAVANADIVITSVMSDDVLNLHLGSKNHSGIIDFLKKGAILIITSTLDPQKIMEIQEHMPSETYLLDAPMIGGVKYARNAKLEFIVGGPHTIADKVASILSVMGTFNYVGKIGNGAKLKLITNDTIMAAEAGIRETLDLSDAYGIDYQTTLDLLQKGPLKPVVVRALDKTNPRPLADSLADVDELVGATKKLIDLPIVKSAQNRLKKAVNVKPQAEFIDITNKSTALKQFRDS